MQQSKDSIRKIIRQKRRSLSLQEVEKWSKKINQNFLQNLLPKIYQKNSKKIFSIYLPAYNEVDTRIIKEFFIKNNISFSYPKIVEKNQPLEFILYKKNQNFKPSKFYPSILEPDENEVILPDILIIPLLAFDNKMNRIGAGGGFFDRTIEFLIKQNLNLIKIGLAYDFQGLNHDIICEKTDKKLDFIVTPNNILSMKSIVS